jgi:uracil-DNA glycosylase
VVQGKRFEQLIVLNEAVVECRRCPRLVAWREAAAQKAPARFQEVYWGRPVPSFGDPDATLVVVGLAPGANGANRTGRPFTGDRSGEWLYRALWRAGYANQPTSDHRGDGLELAGAWITGAVRCAPPDNRPTPAERDNCLGYLATELTLLEKAKVVVALGRFAHESLCRVLGLSPRPGFAHLGETTCPAPAPVLLGSYHPSQQNTFTGVLSQEMFDAVFTRARQLGA